VGLKKATEYAGFVELAKFTESVVFIEHMEVVKLVAFVKLTKSKAVLLPKKIGNQRPVIEAS
jgi:hypothetical protein